MELTLNEAHALARDAMRTVGHDKNEARIIADHLIGCELRGQDYGGLARALSIIERIQARPEGRKPVSIVKETTVSVLLDGGDQAGYLAAHRATTMGIEKAKSHGIAIAGVANTWYTGMFAHYMEMATAEGLVGMAAGSSDWRVAPVGSSEARFGTNPIAFGFPSEDEPVIMDAGVSSIMMSEATLARRLEQKLEPGIAWTSDGTPTQDPTEGLAGAFAVWGSGKGSALGATIQLFGLLAGGLVKPDPLSDCSLFLMFLKPDLLVGETQLRRNVSEYAEALRNARALDPEHPPRMPFDRALAERRQRLSAGKIEVADHVVMRLREINARPQ
ncbi:MAG: Ldh family oxidoreductase [Pseudorhodobacter sp.]